MRNARILNHINCRANQVTKKPNKQFKHPASNPEPEEIRAARDAVNLTQTQAGDLVHAKLRTWQQWEAGDRKMHPGFWELFRIKTALIVRSTETG